MSHRALELDGFFGTTSVSANEYEIGTWNVGSVCKAGSLKAVASELAKYNVDPWQYQRSDGMSMVTGRQFYSYSSGNGNDNQRCFLRKGIISAITMVEFISDRISHMTLRSMV
jgi:hypothetical protein